MGKKPKVFVSYCHDNPAHRGRVQAWASRLGKDGVDVVLDTASLRLGNNVTRFMERIVNDPAITNILVFSDSHYARKAATGQGGCGTEAQLIAQLVYPDPEQTKVVAIRCEKNHTGRACLPVSLRSTLYLDFFTDADVETNWDTLLGHLEYCAAKSEQAVASLPTANEDGDTTADAPQQEGEPLETGAEDVQDESKPSHEQEEENLPLGRECLVLVSEDGEHWRGASGAFWCTKHVLTCKHTLMIDDVLQHPSHILVFYAGSGYLKVSRVIQTPDDRTLDAVLLELEGGPEFLPPRLSFRFKGEPLDGVGYPDSMACSGLDGVEPSAGSLRLYAEGTAELHNTQTNLVVKGVGELGDLNKLRGQLGGYSGTLLFSRTGRAVGLVVSLVAEGYSQIRLLTLRGLDPLLRLLQDPWEEAVRKYAKQRGSSFLKSLGDSDPVGLVLRLGRLPIEEYYKEFMAYVNSSASIDDLRELFKLSSPRLVCHAPFRDGMHFSDSVVSAELIRASHTGWLCVTSYCNPRDENERSVVCYPLTIRLCPQCLGASLDSLKAAVSLELIKLLRPDAISGSDPSAAVLLSNRIQKIIRSRLRAREMDLGSEYPMFESPKVALLIYVEEQGLQTALVSHATMMKTFFQVGRVLVYSQDCDSEWVETVELLEALYEKISE